jgi:cystinosin
MWAHHYVSIGPYEGNETLTVLALEAVHAGKSFFRFTNVSEPLFVNWKDVVRPANVVHLLPLNVLAAVIGWIYFACWTVSYYPQPLLNCYRRSVVGLNVDFVILSVIGYIGYLVFNLSLFFSSAIQDQYFLRHPGGINPVRPSDVAFSIHSMIMSSFVLLQVIFLKRGQQKVSRINKAIIVVLFLGIYVCGLLSVGNNVIKWLDFLYIMSYVKLFINIIKDVPQLWQIYRTKTTAGYSMLGVWIDLAGGVFSLLQMFILAYNYDDWTSLFGDPTKFGVGVFSILTDFIVMWQHYVLYGAKEKDGKNAERVMLMRIVRRPCPCVLNLLRCFKRRRFNAKDRGYDSVNEHSRLINDNC